MKALDVFLAALILFALSPATSFAPLESAAYANNMDGKAGGCYGCARYDKPKPKAAAKKKK